MSLALADLVLLGVLLTQFAAVGPAEIPTLPDQVELHASVPNSLHPDTEVRILLPTTSDISLVVYGPKGRQLRTLAKGTMDAGEHVLSWDGRDAGGDELDAGMYYLGFQAGGEWQIRRAPLDR